MGVHGRYRGRVMALYVLVFLGSTPVGASLAGWWAERFGVPSSIWGAGLISFLTAMVALVWQLRTSGERLNLQVRPRPSLSLVRSAPDADTVVADAVTASVPEPARSAA
jgi:protein-S-isoprenylcysteine O-methyltransferase Ste14